MTSRREAILQAARSMVVTDPFFPAVGIDLPDAQNYRKDCGGVALGLADACAVQDGPLFVTRDGGSEDDYELNLEVSIVYAVHGADQALRRARRDEASERLANLVRADRTLGLGDPQVYAEIAPPDRDDNIPIPGAPPMALLRFVLKVDYVAPSPAE